MEDEDYLHRGHSIKTKYNTVQHPNMVQIEDQEDDIFN